MILTQERRKKVKKDIENPNKKILLDNFCIFGLQMPALDI